MEEIKYIAIVSKLENGKYKITFPDFDNVFTNSDSEENITKVATNLLEFKIKEYAENNTPLPEATSIFDIQKNLQENEISTYVSVKKSSNNFFNTDNLKTENLKKLINEDKINDIYQKYNPIISTIKIICGAIYILTVFLSVVVAEIPFFGTLKMTYFSGLFTENNFVNEYMSMIPNGYSMIVFARTFGLLIIFAGAFVIFTEVKKLKEYYSYSAYTPIVLSLFIFIVLKMKMISNIPAEGRNFISLGAGVYLPILLGIALAVIEYVRSVGEKKAGGN